MQNTRTDNIYFPLCFLSYVSEEQREEIARIPGAMAVPEIRHIAGKIISFGLVEYAKKLKNEWLLNDCERNEIEEYIRKNKLIAYIGNDIFDRYIVLSAINIGIDIANLEKTKLSHKELDNYRARFENVYGTDAKVKIHKDILFEVREGQFDERMFRVYCGVLSVIGDKQFVRITKERIMYAMLGCKSEKVFQRFEQNYKLLTERKVKTTIDKLRDRGFFDCITYGKRMTFYSTKFREAALHSVVAEAIAKNKLKKEKSKLKSEMLKDIVENKLTLLRTEYIKKQAEPEEETVNMELLPNTKKCQC